MSLLKLKLREQGLMVLLFFMIVSCDQLLPPAGSGELVQVKIRAVSIAGGAQNEIVTRAGGSERRIVGEPIVQDLGGGMLAGITVEEDLSALRDDPAPQRLGGGVKFRIIALKSGSLHDYADYTMPASEPGGGSIAPDEGFDALECEVGETYDFICYSYNSSDALPKWSDGDLSALSVDNSKDLLYWSETGNEIEEGEALSINMKQQLAKVQLTLDTRYNNWPVSTIDNLPGIETVATSATFSLASGNFGNLDDTDKLSFSGFSSTSSTTLVSDLIRVVPQEEPISLSLPVGMVKASNLLISLPVIQKTIASAVTPETGKSYAFHLKIYLPKFASSNVYWEGDGKGNGMLTFAPYSDTPGISYADEQRYQGVMFKYGSLIGIAPHYNPRQSFDVSTIPLFVHTGSGWAQTVATNMGYGHFDNILYYSASGGSARELIDLPSSNWAARVGDICQLISTTRGEYNANDKPLYRLPMAAEYGVGSGVWTSISGASSPINIGINWPTFCGKFVIPSNYYAASFAPTGLIFPAGGHYLGGPAVLIPSAGAMGFYQTGGSDYTAFSFSSSQPMQLISFATSTKTASTVAQPVRCMLNPD